MMINFVISYKMSLRAVFDAPCSICGELIRKGEVTRPLKSASFQSFHSKEEESSESNDNDYSCSFKNNRILWSHLACAPSNDDPRIPICKHWLRRGCCVYQESCLFRHPPKSELLDDEKLHQRYKGSKKCNRRRVLNEGRAAALRRWVLNIFGNDYLRSGSGVLDVAGGKGELAFEFENLSSIPTCVIDPRALDLNRFNRKLEFGYYHRNEVLGRFNQRPKPSSRSEVRAPTQIRAFFEMVSSSGSNKTKAGQFHDADSNGSESDCSSDCSFDLVEKSAYSNQIVSAKENITFHYPTVLRSENAFASGIHMGLRTRWTSKGLEDVSENFHEELSEELIADLESKLKLSNINENSPDIRNTDVADTPFPSPREVREYDEARSIVRDCSIVVGMHPDQAAEHILDFAILNNKPCAFIPCCVYSNQFPRRRSAAGKPVRKYGDLIEYLLAKLSVCVMCSDQASSNQSADIASLGIPIMPTNVNSDTRGNSSTGRNFKEPSADPPRIAQFGIVEMDFEGKNLLIFYTAGRQLLSDPYASQIHISRGPARSEQWWALSDYCTKNQGH